MLSDRRFLPLESIAFSYIQEVCENASPDTVQRVMKVLGLRLREQISAEEAVRSCYNMLGTPLPAQKVNAIVATPPSPIRRMPISSAADGSTGRQKARNWIPYEDQRLLAGILRFGCDNWPRIAEFVGNGRSRSQCAQRWNRGLNPAIYKGPWTKEDEDELLSLVDKFGEKSWRQIAAVFGNRSDVQCRYHYQQLCKARERMTAAEAKSRSGGSASEKYTSDESASEKSGSDESSCASPQPRVFVGEDSKWNFDFLRPDEGEFLFDSFMGCDLWP